MKLLIVEVEVMIFPFEQSKAEQKIMRLIYYRPNEVVPILLAASVKA